MARTIDDSIVFVVPCTSLLVNVARPPREDFQIIARSCPTVRIHWWWPCPSHSVHHQYTRGGHVPHSLSNANTPVVAQPPSLKAAHIEVTHKVDQLLPHEVAQLLPHHSASGTPHSFLDQWHTFIFWTNGTHSLSFYPPFLDQWHTFIVGPMAHIHFLDANGMATRSLHEPRLRLAVCLLCLVFLDGTHSLRFYCP